MTTDSDSSAGPAFETGVSAHLVRPGALVEIETIAGADAHHLGRVRRSRVGEHVTVADGYGNWRRYEIRSITADRIEAIATGESFRSSAPPRRVTVASALSKGTKIETITQQLAELGVARFVPFVGRRSVVRLDAAARHKLHERLVATARSAAMQSRRAWLCEVTPVSTVDELADRLDRELLVAAIDGERDPDSLVGSGDLSVITGPEGGFDTTERELFATWGARSWCLADGVLRAETAPLAAATLLLS